MDHRGAEPGAVAAVSRVDVLDHLLAALVLEVDIDVRGLVAGFGDEALEHHRDGVGVDLGDPQHIANGGVGRRAPALREDAAAPREGDDVVHG